MEKIVYCEHIPRGVAIKIENNIILIGTGKINIKGDVKTA
ncbi:hypothetical protein QF028_004425 [Neobacillus sp. B4I6]